MTDTEIARAIIANIPRYNLTYMLYHGIPDDEDIYNVEITADDVQRVWGKIIEAAVRGIE